MKAKKPPAAPYAPMPARLDRRRIFILPTRHGMLFLAVLFAMLVGSINYNNNLGFLLVFMLGGMVLVSIIHTWRNLLGLEILSVSAEPVFAGQNVVFSLHVRNGGFSRRAVSFGFEKKPGVLESMEPGMERRIEVSSSRPGRGIYRPGRLVVSTSYPLGLFRAWSKLGANASCIVYPAPAESRFSADAMHAPGDSENERIQSGADDFRGLKAYKPGDPIRHIAWKTLSRGQGVFTKEFGQDAADALLLDYYAVPGADTEEKLSRLADLIIKAEGINASYGLELPDKSLPPGRGERQKRSCLKALALFDTESGERNE